MINETIAKGLIVGFSVIGISLMIAIIGMMIKLGGKLLLEGDKEISDNWCAIIGLTIVILSFVCGVWW